MADHGDQERTIQAEAKECRGLFGDMMAYLSRHDPLSIGIELQDELGRFNLWAGNIGVFAPLQASLDFRLIDVPEIGSQFLRQLDTLSISLTQLKEAAAEDAIEEHEDLHDDDAPRAADRSLFLDHEIVELVQSIHVTIDWLHRLSNLVRKASFNSQNQRASTFPLTDEGGNDITECLSKIFGHLIKRECNDISTDILDRLIRTMIIRRRRVLYRRSRQKRWILDREAYRPRSLNQPAHLAPVKEIDESEEDSRDLKIIEDARFDSKSHVQVAPSRLTVTTLDQQQYRKLTASSRLSRATTVPFQSDEKLLVPPRPYLAKEGKEFVCDYCCLILPSCEAADRNTWADHVKKDLDPYICVFDGCNQPYQIYSSSQQWLAHMRSEHRMSWRCVVRDHRPQTFETRAAFLQHMTDVHPGKFREDQLSFIAQSSARVLSPTVPACPFCAEDSGDLESHVARHLHHFALQSLPWPDHLDQGSEIGSGPEISSSSPGDGDRETLKDDLDDNSNSVNADWSNSLAHEPALLEIPVVWPHLKRAFPEPDQVLVEFAAQAAKRAATHPNDNDRKPETLEDAYIAVMGATGAGKSTFVSRLCGEGPKIGHSLESCENVPKVSRKLSLTQTGTANIGVFDFQYDGRTIHLIDTPGFDDTHHTNFDVLRNIALWLNTSYQQQVRLNGIVYLQSIQSNRFTGASRRNIMIFRQLCGDSNLQSVVLATTMWNANMDEATKRVCEYRQEQLETIPHFWGGMVSCGSLVVRHDDNAGSALNIVRYILKQDRRITLRIQREMMEEGKRLHQTLAGQELSSELLEQMRLDENALKQAIAEMKQAVDEISKRTVREAAQDHEDLEQRLDSARKGIEQLKIQMERIEEPTPLRTEYKNILEALETELDDLDQQGTPRHRTIVPKFPKLFLPKDGGPRQFHEIVDLKTHISVASASPPDSQIDCQLHLSKLKFGTLDGIPAGIIYMDISISNPKENRSVDVTVTLNDDDPELQQLVQDAPGTLLKRSKSPVTFTEFYGPRNMSWIDGEDGELRSSHLVPEVNAMGTAVGGIGAGREMTTMQTQTWTFSAHLLTRKNSSTHRTLRWNFSTNSIGHALHERRIHTGFVFQGGGQPFSLEVEIGERLQTLSDRIIQASGQFERADRSSSGLGKILFDPGPDVEKVYSQPLDELARAISEALHRENVLEANFVISDARSLQSGGMPSGHGLEGGLESQASFEPSFRGTAVYDFDAPHQKGQPREGISVGGTKATDQNSSAHHPPLTNAGPVSEYRDSQQQKVDENLIIASDKTTSEEGSKEWRNEVNLPEGSLWESESSSSSSNFGERPSHMSLEDVAFTPVSRGSIYRECHKGSCDRRSLIVGERRRLRISRYCAYHTCEARGPRGQFCPNAKRSDVRYCRGHIEEDRDSNTDTPGRIFADLIRERERVQEEERKRQQEEITARDNSQAYETQDRSGGQMTEDNLRPHEISTELRELQRARRKGNSPVRKFLDFFRGRGKARTGEEESPGAE